MKPTAEELRAFVLAFVEAEESVGEALIRNVVEKRFNIKIPIAAFQGYLASLHDKGLLVYRSMGYANSNNFMKKLDEARNSDTPDIRDLDLNANDLPTPHADNPTGGETA
jgi:hypothetical protein